MKKEYLLYGLAKGVTESYREDLLLVTTDKLLIEKCKILAAKDGFHSFRTAEFNGEKPDFIKTINNQ